MFHMPVFPVLYRKNYRWSEESRSTCSFMSKCACQDFFFRNVNTAAATSAKSITASAA